MKVNNVLKSFVLALCATLIIVSCNKDAGIEKDRSFAQELAKREHLQKMLQLCSEYGWVKDEDASQQELEELLLSLDYNTTKNFFDLTKTKAAHVDINILPQSTTKAATGVVKQRYYLTGTHEIFVGGSIRPDVKLKVEVIVQYDRETLEVIHSNVGPYPIDISEIECSWDPRNKNQTFYFNGDFCSFDASGVLRLKKILMYPISIRGNIRLMPNSLDVKYGYMNILG